MNLLEKSRRINAMLQQTGAEQVDFGKMAESLSEVIEANVFIVSRYGRLIGFHIGHDIENKRMQKMIEEHQFPEEYTENLYYVRETRSNIGVKDELSAIPVENIELFRDGMTTIVPVVCSNERLGTLVLARINGQFEEGDLIIAEFGATVVGMEILRERAEQEEVSNRRKAVVQMAMSSLSFSELEAIDHIFAELEDNEGILIASKIADRVGITRSVIVNALRKLESAGVIESRSLGMKGTFIRILNEKFQEELLQKKSSIISS